MMFGIFFVFASIVVFAMAVIVKRDSKKFWSRCSYAQAKLVGVREIQNSPNITPLVCFEYEGRQITAHMQPIPETSAPRVGDLIEIAYLKESVFQHETWGVKAVHGGKRKDKIFQGILLSAAGILFCVGICLLVYEVFF